MHEEAILEKMSPSLSDGESEPFGLPVRTARTVSIELRKRDSGCCPRVILKLRLFKSLRRQDLCDVLFAVANAHLHTIFVVDIFRQVLRSVDGTMLSAGASEGEHQRRESALYVALHMGIGQLVDVVKEGQNFAVVFKETDDGLIESR